MSLIIDSLAKLAEKFSQKYPGEASGVATLDGSSKVVEDPGSAAYTKGGASGIASLDASGNVLQGPASSIWPSFEVGSTSTLSLTSGVARKVIFDTEVWDTNDDFEHDGDRSDGATESRFTPSVAGKYLLTVGLEIQGTANTITRSHIDIYKNGSTFRRIVIFDSTTNPVTRPPGSGSVLVDANGSSDYFEMFVDVEGTSPIVVGSLSQVHWGGTRVA